MIAKTLVATKISIQVTRCAVVRIYATLEAVFSTYGALFSTYFVSMIIADAISSTDDPMVCRGIATGAVRRYN